MKVLNAVAVMLLLVGLVVMGRMSVKPDQKLTNAVATLSTQVAELQKEKLATKPVALATLPSLPVVASAPCSCECRQQHATRNVSRAPIAMKVRIPAPVSTPVLETRRGLEVVNLSGKDLEFYANILIGGNVKEVPMGTILAGRQIFLPCSHDNISLTFKRGLLRKNIHVQQSFQRGSVGEVHKVVL